MNRVRIKHPDPLNVFSNIPGMGHNMGPDLDDYGASWRLRCWQKAAKKAWKTPPREVLLRRVKRAKELGMSYREYTLEIMERGRYL